MAIAKLAESHNNRGTMSKRPFGILLLSVAAGIVLAGCASTEPASSRGPTTVRVDEKTVWVPDYWYDTGGHWALVPAHQEVGPPAGAVWMPGHWEMTAEQKWVWNKGYWK